MSWFKYSASDSSGKIKRGRLQVQNSDMLRDSLKRQGLYLINFDERGSNTSYSRLKSDKLSDFCREMSSFLNSGINVVRALSIISGRTADISMKNICSNILVHLKRGISLSEAMKMQGKVFPEMLISMIKTGEESGKLDRTFEKMSVHYEKEYRLSSAVKSAMTYPIVLIILLIVVMIGLFTFVLPAFFELFENIEVPLITQIVMQLSLFLQHNFISVIIITTLFIFLIKTIFQISGVKYFLDKFKLKIPFLGNLLSIIYTAQFARTLASLYSSGINIVDAILISKDTIQNTYIRRQFDGAVKKIRSGRTLSETIGEIDGFDIKLAMTAQTGEETGHLDEMLIKTAESYEFESQKAVSRIITLIQPAMIIIIAGIVLLVVLSVMIPIFSMYENIDNIGVRKY